MDDFAGFFGARRDTVYRTVLFAVGDRAAAEDAVGEAFARAYQRWPAVRRHPNPTAWVIRVALNVSRSWWRRRRREFLTGDDTALAAPALRSGREPIERLDERLEAELARLPRRQREVVALRILADLSAEDAARLLGMAPATVHVHLHRALGSLRRALAEPPTKHPTEAGR